MNFHQKGENLFDVYLFLIRVRTQSNENGHNTSTLNLNKTPPRLQISKRNI